MRRPLLPRSIRFPTLCLALGLVLGACGSAVTPTATPLPVVASPTATPVPDIPESTDAEGHYILGDPSAPVAIIDYSDFQ